VLTPKGQQLPPPPQELRPWYYHNWFLIPAFVLGWPITPVSIVWPLWAVLIIRSPWHNGIISGALAWAMLMTGAFMLVRQMESDSATAMKVLLPGVVLTVVIQVLWSKHKRALPAASLTGVEESTQNSPPETSGEDSPGLASDVRATPRFRNTGVRRRSPRRRSSRSGRRPPPS
jgi:hypothetical protein